MLLQILKEQIEKGAYPGIVKTTLDGVNLFPYLLGAETGQPHDKLFWRYGTTQYAVRAGDWKLLFFQNTTRLYNLATDPAETANLANTNAAKFNELKAIYDQWNAQLPPAPVAQP